MKDKLTNRQSSYRLELAVLSAAQLIVIMFLYPQWVTDKSAIVRSRDRLRVEVYFFPLSLFVAFSEIINKCSMFLLFRSLYPHLPYYNRTSTTSVSVKSIQSLHEVKTCTAHRSDVLIFAGRDFFKLTSFNLDLKNKILIFS